MVAQAVLDRVQPGGERCHAAARVGGGGHHDRQQYAQQLAAQLDISRHHAAQSRRQLHDERRSTFAQRNGRWLGANNGNAKSNDASHRYSLVGESAAGLAHGGSDSCCRSAVDRSRHPPEASAPLRRQVHRLAK